MNDTDKRRSDQKITGAGKRFYEWMGIKARAHDKTRLRSFKEGEIWWTSIGENVGVEINGKGSGFSRPVVIVRKFSILGCFAVPLTSREHTGSWYAEFEYDGRMEYASLTQARFISSKRLTRRMGQVSQGDYYKITTALRNLLFSEKNTPSREAGEGG